MVFLKEFFKEVDIEKKDQQMTKKQEKLPVGKELRKLFYFQKGCHINSEIYPFRNLQKGNSSLMFALFHFELSKLRKSDKMQGLPSILLLFCN